MIVQAILGSLCAVIMLSACSSPKKAEHYSHLTFIVDTSTSLDKTQMQIYIASAASQLLRLEQKESEHCISGQLAIAQYYLSRATAEHNAAMEKDAFITLVQFDRQIRKIHCINQYINNQLGCGYTNKKVVLKRWYDEGDLNQCENPSIAKNKTILKQKHLLITETLHDFNQDEIKPIYYQALNKLVDLMKSHPHSTLVISGHTDSKGSAAYNMKLSEKRAHSVAKYFTERGIAPSKLSIEHQGENNIRELEQSDAARVFNRYTSITLLLDNRDNKII